METLSVRQRAMARKAGVQLSSQTTQKDGVKAMKKVSAFKNEKVFSTSGKI